MAPRRCCPTLPALLLAMALAACASGRIWLDHDSPDGITLHWYTKETTIDAARAEANNHCQAWAKQAVLLDEFEDRDVTTAHFACR